MTRAFECSGIAVRIKTVITVRISQNTQLTTELLLEVVKCFDSDYYSKTFKTYDHLLDHYTLTPTASES